MMTTLLDLLSMLGEATWEPVWVPVLAWTVFVLPLWLLLERTDRLHPHAEYRLYQVLLAALPVGMLATVLLDGWWASATGMSGTGLSVVVMPPMDTTARSVSGSSSLTWFHGVGLATTAALGVGVVGLSRLALDAAALARVRMCIDGSSHAAELQATVDRTARTLGVARPVHVCTTPQVAVPITLGGLRPTILLPPRLADQPDALRMTLIHELVHIHRYDDISHLVERVVGALFAAHPLVGRLTRRSAEVRERACDTAVLADDTTSASAYARLLAAFADEHAPQPGTLTLSESPSSLTNRLRAMQSSVSEWLSSPVSLAASLLLTGIVVTFGVVACSDSIAPSAVPSDESSSPSETVSAENVQTPPSPKGGITALQEEVTYPEMTQKAGIQGQVLVQFVVDASGQAQQIQVKKSVHEALDSAAVDAVRSVEFEPGVKDGKAVPVEMTLPITFKLPKEESSSSDDTAQSTPSVVDNINFVFHALNSSEQDRLRSTGPVFTQATRAALPFSYPDLVRKAGIDGTVEVTFTLNEAGNAQNPRITQSVHEALDAAALQSVKNTTFVVKDTQKWATGKKISVQFEPPSPTGTS